MGKPARIMNPSPAVTGDAPRVAAPVMIGYVSASTLAHLLDCGETKIWEDTKRGILPKPYQIGGAKRWKWSEVENHIESGSHGPTSPADPILGAARGR